MTNPFIIAGEVCGADAGVGVSCYEAVLDHGAVEEMGWAGGGAGGVEAGVAEGFYGDHGWRE